MSTLDINSIRDYLIEVGCKVEYPILVNAFKKHLYNPDPNIQSTVRTQFKDYVNRLSTVNVENNMKFITLRPEFRPVEHPLKLPSDNEAKPKHLLQQKQQPPQVQSPPPPPLPPPPMMTSSPKNRSPPGQHAPKTISLTSPPAPGHIHDHQPLTQSHTRNDRLDSPRAVPSIGQHSQHHQMQPSSPNQPVQSRRQHQQSTPRPPPVPQHHKPTPAPIAKDMAPPNANSSNRPTQPVEMDRRHQTVTQAQQQYISPPNQQQQHQLNHHYRSQSQPVPRQMQQSLQPSHQPPPQQQHVSNDNNSNKDPAALTDASLMPPPPAPLQQHYQQQQQQQQEQRRHRSPLSRQSSSLQKLDTMPPPRPPPRRRQSTASLYKPSPNKSIDKSSSRDMQELARKSLAGRISRDHHAAHRSYSSASTNDLSPFMAKRNSSMKENHRLSRESNLGNLSSSFQSISFNRIKRSRSSPRGEDESDSSSLQPNDPLRRKWTIEATSCNYNSLLLLLREDPKLAFCKDIMNGYTALHWAAKFGNLEIIRLIAGTYGVSVNIKSSAGQTPLHVAYMFNRSEAVNLLLQNYQASTEVRDHSGRRPMQYWQKPNATNTR